EPGLPFAPDRNSNNPEGGFMLRHLCVAVIIASFAPLLRADDFKIDPIHATVIYRVSHLNVGQAYGRFDEPTGMVTLDSGDPSKDSFTFEVQTNKVDTGNPKRDQHLQSPDFFD